jgi:hypothetical protein
VPISVLAFQKTTTNYMGCGTLLALGLGAVGTGMQVSAASQERKAMNDVANTQIQQQDALTQRGLKQFQTALGNSTPEAQVKNQQTGASQVMDASRKAAVTPLAMPGGANPNQGQAVSYGGQAIKNQLAHQANAQMQGFGNVPLQLGLSNLNTNSNMGLIGSTSQRLASIYPFLMQNAAQSQSGRASAGNLLGSLGMMLGKMGASGTANDVSGGDSGGGGGAPQTDGMGFANFGPMMGQQPQQLWAPSQGGYQTL